MELDFTVPGGITLKEAQKEAIIFCYRQANAIISLQTGLGKTLTSCVLTRELFKAYEGLLACYIVPQKAVKAFKKELNRLGMKYSTWTSEGKDNKQGSRILIVTHTALDKYKMDIAKIASTRKMMCVVDEIHNFANPRTVLFKALASIRKFFPLFYALTATVVRNDLNSLYYLSTITRPGFFGTLEQFQYQYLNLRQKAIRIRGARKMINEAVGVRNPEALKAKLEQLIIFRQQEYNLEFHTINIPMEEEIWNRYRQAGLGLLRETAEKNWAVRLVDLQYAVDNILPNYEPLTLTEKEKRFIALVKKLFDTGNIPIVYCFYLEGINRLKELLERYRFQIGLDQVYVISGEVPKKERYLIEDKIKQRTITIINKAGTESINLQKANCMIYYDLPWSIDEFSQSVGRITRTDTEFNKQHVFFLEMEGTIDSYRSLRIRNHAAIVEQVQGKQNTLTGELLISNSDMDKLRTLLLWCFKNNRPTTKKQIYETLGVVEEVKEDENS